MHKKRYLLINEDPQLRKESKPVIDFAKAKEVADDLLEMLRKLKGSGLSAPQIGENLRIFIIEVEKSKEFPHIEEIPLHIVINPEIISQSDEMVENIEGCFSVPGVRGIVKRHKSIVIRYQTFGNEGKVEEKIEECTGYLAKAMQHERDHLDGILYLDKARNITKLESPKDWSKFYKPKDNNEKTIEF